MRCFVLMGVSGCGKTSVGTDLAARIDMKFIDGDDLHPPQNIEKMAQGTPLDDSDREPWLADVGRALAKANGPVVIGCSALKRKYRDWIRQNAGEDVFFLHLDASRDVLLERVNSREGHFMPPALLDSQFSALERLEHDEHGRGIDISRPYEDVIQNTETLVRKELS